MPNIIKLKRPASVKVPTTSDLVAGEVAIGQPSSGKFGLYYHDGTNVKLVGDGIFVPTTRQINTSGGLTGGGSLENDLTISTTGILNAIHNLGTNGIIVKTGSGTAATRAITGTANQITVLNGDGVSGNPAIGLADDVTISSSLTINGLTASRLVSTDATKKLVSTSLSSWISGTTNQITVTDNGNGGVTLSTPQDLHTSANVTFNSVTINGTPTNSNHAVTKGYVDSLARGLKAKQSVRVATTGNINLNSPGSTIDGITLNTGDRVLVWQQTNSAQNGIYVWNGASTPMTRSEDADSWDELVSAFVFVEQGNTYGDKAFYCTIDRGGTLGTDPVTWIQFADISVPDAGDGLYINNGAYHVGAGDGISVGADSVSVKLHTTNPGLEIDSGTKGLKVKVNTSRGLVVDASGVGLSDTIYNKIHDQNTDTGTTSQTFHIDSDDNGPKLKNSWGTLEIRNSTDEDFVDISISKLILNSSSGRGIVRFNGFAEASYILDFEPGQADYTLLTDFSIIDGGTY